MFVWDSWPAIVVVGSVMAGCIYITYRNLFMEN
jgi:hypothetical protein